MNKHDELVERLGYFAQNCEHDLTEDELAIQIDAIRLIKLYGDALVRLGDETAMTGRARNDSAWAIGENNARVKYARKTVERACIVNG